MCGIESIQSRITPSLDTGRKELFLNVIDSTITKWQHRMCNFFKLAMKMDVHNIRTKQQFVIYHWETKGRVIHIIVVKRLISWLFEHSNLIYWKAAITCNTILLTLLVIVTTSWHKLRRHCITMHISNNIICLWYSLVWFTIFRIKVTVVNQERYEAVVI